MSYFKRIVLVILTVFFLTNCGGPSVPQAPAFTILERVYTYKEASKIDLIDKVDPLAGGKANGIIQAVIEIPAGSNEKWEVAKDGKSIIWEFKDAKPRVIDYLGYPGNYGFIPRSLLPREKGGDGDPLDIIVLGNALPRGRRANVKLIGVLKIMDTGEQDDKLIAVDSSAPFYPNVNEIDTLKEKYPGILEILRLWFENYKGPGVMEFKGFGSREEAWEVVAVALRSYEEYNKKDKKKML